MLASQPVKVISKSTMIHPTAVISPQAQIDPTAEIGPWCYIEGPVTIGPCTRLSRGVTVIGPCVIGADNQIGTQTVLGGEPEDPAYQGEPSQLRIGDRNRIFESVVVSRGSGRGRQETVIGDDNFLMSFVHVAHDCLIGNHVRITAYTGLAGHVVVDDHATISGMVALQQFIRIGAYSFISAKSAVGWDVLPFSTTFGTACPAYLHGANLIGLERQGFPREKVRTLRQVMALWREKDRSVQSILEEMDATWPDDALVKQVSDFARASSRGVLR